MYHLLTLLSSVFLLLGISRKSISAKHFDSENHVALIPHQQGIRFRNVMKHHKLRPATCEEHVRSICLKFNVINFAMGAQNNGHTIVLVLFGDVLLQKLSRYWLQ